MHGNPLSGVDPLGLYERDVHYYMTFFLGVTAGMTPEDARTMALATQYIDDNPQTRPVEPGSIFTQVGSMFSNQSQLLKYHFTLWTKTGPGEYDFTYNSSTDITNPSSQQLNDLYGYAANVPEGECGYSTNTRLQFMGEYLHAFEDTFAHRDQNNKPYEPLGWFNWGTGHGLSGHDPDYTYNHDVCVASTGPHALPGQQTCTSWNNQDRTLQMERETYQKIRDYMASQNYEMTKTGKQTDFAQLEEVLRDFNRANENADNTGDFTKSDLKEKGKLAILQAWLTKNGYKNTDGSEIDFSSGKNRYDESAAASNRTENFKDAKAEDHPSAILPAG